MLRTRACGHWQLAAVARGTARACAVLQAIYVGFYKLYVFNYNNINTYRLALAFKSLARAIRGAYYNM